MYHSCITRRRITGCRARHNSMIIDIHTHIFSPGLCADREPFLNDGQFSILYGSREARCVDHRALADAMRSSGVERAVAMGFPWERQDHCAAQNDYLRRAHDESGGAILPFGSVPVSGEADVRSWVRDIRRAGLFGVGEVAFYRDGMTPANIDLLRRLLAAVTDEGIPLCLHVNEPVGHPYPGKYEPGMHELYAAIADHPDATVILSHWGGGLLFYELMPEVSGTLANCYYDTAATPYLYSERIYQIALGIIGPRRVLFGTDFPLLPPGRYLDPMWKFVADDEARAAILGGNAARLLKLT
jgi:uncharacterized protein